MQYRIDYNRTEKTYEPAELVRMFLSPDELSEEGELIRVPDGVTRKDDVKRWLYRELARRTGKELEWGTLTGVRPVKLFADHARAGGPDAAEDYFRRECYVSDEKTRLVRETWEVQSRTMTAGDPDKVAVYIGIPFCPTRCLYCSFTSNQKGPEEIARYLTALEREIRWTGEAARRAGMEIESVYVGGGTPTTLTAGQLAELLRWTRESFDLSKCREWTVESGRPDTITEEKLEAIVDGGADRISINPQSMKQATLDRIGRSHTPDDIRASFALANGLKKRLGTRADGKPRLVVNADLIAGLPGEEPDDFRASLDEIISLGPENVTVHTLAVKRSSRLHEEDKDFSYRQGTRVGEMLRIAAGTVREAGYRPYYLYRQKQMTGNFENVGYALPGTENLYNMKIMEENQTILALGAGGISKVWYPAENRLERVPNVSNYELYIERLDEMLERKRAGIFASQEEDPK